MSGEEQPGVAYEIVYDCHEEGDGARMAERIRGVIGPTWSIERVSAGPEWALRIEFPSQHDADRFFDSDFYREVCDQIRRQCASAVLVVPLGPTDGQQT